MSSIFNNDIYPMDTNDILVGYYEDQIRSISISTENNIGEGYIFFSSIFLNQTIGDLTFKYYNYENRLIFSIPQSFTIDINDNLGNAQNPIILSLDNNLEIVSLENWIEEFTIINTYPNPFNSFINF